MTTIALPPNVTPTIVCPSWCVTTPDEHLTQLRDYEGLVVHWSAPVDGVRHSEGAYPDGTPDPTDPPWVWPDRIFDGLSIDDAEKLAKALLRAVEEARA